MAAFILERRYFIDGIKEKKLIFTVTTFLITAILVGMDQLLKWIATTYLAPVEAVTVIPGVLELRFLLNDGAAFSSFGGKQTFLILFTSFALLAIAGYLFIKRPSKMEYSAWVLVLSGGIGNLIDRVTNNVVVDYINFLFVNFAVFNFADILICFGIGLLVLHVIMDEVSTGKKED